MNEPIELTDEEQTAAVAAMRREVNSKIWDDDYGLLALAVSAVNLVRAGDPVGTIRRGPHGGIYERRENAAGTRYWAALITLPNLGGTPQDPNNIGETSVIYTPEESA